MQWPCYFQISENEEWHFDFYMKQNGDNYDINKEYFDFDSDLTKFLDNNRIKEVCVIVKISTFSTSIQFQSNKIVRNTVFNSLYLIFLVFHFAYIVASIILL